MQLEVHMKKERNCFGFMDRAGERVADKQQSRKEEVCMIRIVVGGQINKQEIADFTKKFLGDKASVDIKGDLDAAMALKNGQYDYYIRRLQHRRRRGLSPGAGPSGGGKLRYPFPCRARFSPMRRSLLRFKMERRPLALRHSMRKMCCRFCSKPLQKKKESKRV